MLGFGPIFYVYAAALLAALAISIWACKATKANWIAVTGTLLNGAALIPALTLILMRSSGASTTVQFNAGRDDAMNWWSLWVWLWPLFLLGLLAGGAVILAMLITSFVRLARDTASHGDTACLLLSFASAAHIGVVFMWVFSNFPTA